MNQVSDDEFATETEKQFPEKGLNTNKKLKNYDCWDDEFTPEYWLNKYKDQPPPHATCPTYVDNHYVWVDVEILGYNP